MVNYTDSQTASVTSVAGTQTTISVFNVPQGVSWLITDLFCGGDTGQYSLKLDVYPQANFDYIMDSEYGGALNKNVSTPLNRVRIPVSGPAQVTAQITSDNIAAIDFMIKYTSSGGATN